MTTDRDRPGGASPGREAPVQPDDRDRPGGASPERESPVQPDDRDRSGDSSPERESPVQPDDRDRPGGASPGRESPGARPRSLGLGKLLLMVVGLALGGVLLRALGAAPGTEWVDLYIRDQGLLGETLFLLAGGLATAVGVPRQVVAFLAGYAFGTVIGIAVALAAQMLGCVLAYGWARAIARDWAERRLAGRFGPRLRPVVETLRDNPFGAALALRLFPVGNNLALNFLAGMSALPAGAFFLASLLGYLPQTVVFALLGKGVRVDGAWQLGLSGALLALSVGLGVWLMGRHRAGRALEK